MLSKEAEESIKRFKSYSGFIASMYKNPNSMSKTRRSFIRWFINLQGVIGPKVKGTVKEEIYLDGVKTWKITTPNSDPKKIFLYFLTALIIFVGHLLKLLYQDLFYLKCEVI